MPSNEPHPLIYLCLAAALLISLIAITIITVVYGLNILKYIPYICIPRTVQTCVFDCCSSFLWLGTNSKKVSRVCFIVFSEVLHSIVGVSA